MRFGSESQDLTTTLNAELQLSPVLPLQSTELTIDGLSHALKRLMDLVGALVGMLLLAPVMLGIVLLIRLDSSGPVLFRQLRRGRHGRPFHVLKFRTMVVDAEQRLGDLEQHNESEHGVLFKLRDDPESHLWDVSCGDRAWTSCPQLVNILRGEMSLVGPRPLQLRDSDKLRNSIRRVRLPPPGVARADRPLAGRGAERYRLLPHGQAGSRLRRELVPAPGSGDHRPDLHRGTGRPRGLLIVRIRRRAHPHGCLGPARGKSSGPIRGELQSDRTE